MVDMGSLIGDIRRLGLVGPPYEVLGPSTSAILGEPYMRIRLIESGEQVEYAVADILNDPQDD